MNMKKTISRVSKLACGRTIDIPSIGTIRAYKAKSGKRRFAISNTYPKFAGGNLSLNALKEEILLISKNFR